MNLKTIINKAKTHIIWKLRIDDIRYGRLSDKDYIEKMYEKRFKRPLNLENPIRFSEKIQWLKLYNHRPEYTVMVDKEAAKGYVAGVLGEQYITPTLHVWNQFQDIDINVLPDKFVLKCTHDSGGLLICTDKNKVDWRKEKRTFDRCLKRNYYSYSREWPYKGIKPKIIAESYMENNEDGLHDYKVWCFNGEPVYIQYITGRIGNETYEGFYDTDWNLQSFSFHNPLMKEPAKKPKRLEELLCAAKKLAKDQPFVRTDFYVLEDGSIRFGEITFYPMSGMEKWTPDEMDLKLGKMIDLHYGEKIQE